MNNVDMKQSANTKARRRPKTFKITSGSKELETFGKRLTELVNGWFADKTIEQDKTLAVEKINKKKDKVTKKEKYDYDQFFFVFGEKTKCYELDYLKLNGYMNGKHVPSMNLIYAFCDFFGVSVDFLFRPGWETEIPDKKELNKLIHLDEVAIATLMKLEDGYSISVLNALLHNADKVTFLLHEIYDDAFLSYKEKLRLSDSTEEMTEESISKEISQALYISRYIYKYVMIHAKEDFDKRIEEENMYHQYEEDELASNNSIDSVPIITPIQRED